MQPSSSHVHLWWWLDGGYEDTGTEHPISPYDLLFMVAV